MSQSAVTLQRLADNNEKHLQERHDISARKAACETEFARIEQEIHSQVGAYRDMQTKYEQKKRQYEKMNPLCIRHTNTFSKRDQKGHA